MADPVFPITGGCLCGAVRYQSTEPPLKGFYCHCTMCQKNYGGLFMACMKFPGHGFSITKGGIKLFRSSAHAQRGFCAECGSPISFYYDGNPDVWVLLGSLDHPADWPLAKDASWGETIHVCIESKVPWYQIDDGLAQIPSEAMLARAVAIRRAAGLSPDVET